MLNKIRLIFSTAFPGLSKLCIIGIIFLKFGTDTLGVYSVNIALPLTISLFTSLGFAAKIIKEVPISKNKDYTFNKLSYLSITYLFLGLIIIIISFIKSDYILFVISYFITQHFYQIKRNYYIAERQYSDCIKFEVFNLYILIFTIFISNKFNFFECLTIANIILILIFYIKPLINAIKNKVRLYIDKEVFLFSISNLIGGGVGSITPLLLSTNYKIEQIGIISLVSTIGNMFLLFPKAMVNFVLPEYVKTFKSHFDKCKEILIIKRRLFFIVLLISFLCAVFFNFLIFNFGYIFNFHVSSEYSPLSYYITLSIFSSMLALFDGSILFVEGRQKINIISNILYAFLFLILVIVIYFGVIYITLNEFFLIMSIIAIIKYIYLRCMEKKTCC